MDKEIISKITNIVYRADKLTEEIEGINLTIKKLKAANSVRVEIKTDKQRDYGNIKILNADSIMSVMLRDYQNRIDECNKALSEYKIKIHQLTN